MAKRCLVELVSRRHACAKSEAWNNEVTGLIVLIPDVNAVTSAYHWLKAF